MSEREIQDEDLTPFEADLASLVPRAGGLEPGWGDYLAKEAELLGSPAPVDGRLKTCPTAGACPHCGRKAAGGLGRWAWPAAFSAMTAVAATLLAALVVGQVSNLPPIGQASPLAQNTATKVSQTAPPNTEQAGMLVQRERDAPAHSKPAPPALADPSFGPLAAVPRHGWRLSGPAASELQWPAEPTQCPVLRVPKAKSSLAEVASVPMSYRHLLGQVLGQPEGY